MNKENPYVVDKISYRSRFKTLSKGVRSSLCDMETGEIIDGVRIFGKNIIEENTPFVKLYDISLFKILSLQGLRVFGYVLSKLHYDCEWFYFDVGICMEYLGVKSRSSVYNGLDNLIRHDVIRFRNESTYWINPNYVYVGTRRNKKGED